MASTLTWLDQSEEHRRKMREAIGMFRDEGAVDELGMGRIRDAFSDRLFPGTSVLWRRARYLFFVPWVYLLLARGEGGRGSAEERARRLQRKLASTLNASEGFAQGVIGASGADVRQPPDVILWAALQTWGVRTSHGRLGQVRAEAVARSARRRQLEDEHDELSAWNPRVAQLLPDRFPSEASFELTAGEAEVLSNLVLAPDAFTELEMRRADSLLAVLLREGVPEGIDFPWHHAMRTASPGLRRAVHNAGCFSDLIDGARLLYAHLVAETRKDDELKADVTEAFAAWEVVADPSRYNELRAWFDDIEGFWQIVRKANPRIGQGEEAFVREWGRIVMAGPETVRDSPEARHLIIGREHQAKGGVKARLALDGSIGRDAGAVVPARLSFRWSQATSIAQDITAANNGS
jgi:hypothetical protein